MTNLPRPGGLRWLTHATAAVRDAIEKAVPAAKPVPPHDGAKRRASGEAWRPSVPASGLAGLPGVPRGVQDLLDGLAKGGLPGAGLGGGLPPGVGPNVAPGRAAPSVPDGARFLALAFEGPDGNRPYKLYVPSGYRGQPVPLVVMLHGCTQSPDDFAAGTGMNALAEGQTCLVAYPGQVAAAHAQRCWNWYDTAHQGRAGGEPSIIAGITRQVMQEYAVDPRRVYVAGLSAGGAAAAIMGVAYPDLYAAVGVHSGLACGSASSLNAALSAMRQGAAGRSGARAVPAIVFHGDRDTTVHPRNADAVVAQLSPAGLRTRTETGQVPGGHSFQRTVHEGADGRAMLEQWVVHGAGHAWSGGSPAGSYTDPGGPDASREMLRFFLAHTLRAG